MDGSSQKLLYTPAIIFNILFSIISDKCDYYRKNIYVIVMKKMVKLKLKLFYTNKIIQTSTQ